ncbi:MAG: hypothetical protein ACKPE6_11100 [Gammaproteobacteria bacterium]
MGFISVGIAAIFALMAAFDRPISRGRPVDSTDRSDATGEA